MPLCDKRVKHIACPSNRAATGLFSPAELE